MRRFGAGLVLALALGLAACSGGIPKTYPVDGRVVFEKGDVKLLAGSTVHCQQQVEDGFVSSGELKEDGTFTLETHAHGKILPGAPEGTYHAWLEFNTDNGPEEAQFRKMHIDPKYFTGRQAKWVFKVPADGEVVLTATAAKPGAKLPAATKPKHTCGEPDDNPDETQP